MDCASRKGEKGQDKGRDGKRGAGARGRWWWEREQKGDQGWARGVRSFNCPTTIRTRTTTTTAKGPASATSYIYIYSGIFFTGITTTHVAHTPGKVPRCSVSARARDRGDTCALRARFAVMRSKSWSGVQRAKFVRDKTRRRFSPRGTYGIMKSICRRARLHSRAYPEKNRRRISNPSDRRSVGISAFNVS